MLESGYPPIIHEDIHGTGVVVEGTGGAGLRTERSDVVPHIALCNNLATLSADSCCRHSLVLLNLFVIPFILIDPVDDFLYLALDEVLGA